MKPLAFGVALGCAAYLIYDQLLPRYQLRGQQRRYLTGGIAAYLDFLNSLPVKGGESQ